MIDQRIREIVDLINEINLRSLAIGKNLEVFRKIHVRPPSFSCNEAGFIRSVSWLYVIYRESGKVSVNFLLEKLYIYDFDNHDAIEKHFKYVYFLRTYSHHGMNLDNARDQMLKKQYDQWFIKTCGSIIPIADKQWGLCLDRILSGAINCFNGFNECVEKISNDDFCKEIVDDWNLKCSRYYPPYKCDELISIVASDLGHEHLKPSSIRKRYYDIWSKELALIKTDVNIERELRKKIEKVILEGAVLPITGDDIIKELNILDF
jgi:hypothetical protein